MEVVSVLLEAGCDKEDVDNQGRTALIIAAHRQNPEIVRALLGAGCNMNHADNNGLTPLRRWGLREYSFIRLFHVSK